MNELILKWGIVSAGHISKDFCEAVKSFKSEHQFIQAIAARNLEDAQVFAKKFNIPTSYGSYDDLMQDKEVNVVYVGSITATHKEICLKAINAGKHVLCEKPMTLNSREQEEILKASREKNVFFMEALWTRFIPVTDRIKEKIANDAIGEVKFFSGNFTAAIRDVERIKNKQLGGGAILDIGIYPIQMACNLFNHQKPVKIVATGHLMETGVDECCTIVLLYPNQRIASMNVSINCAKFTPAFIIGEKGTIQISEHTSFEYTLNGVTYKEQMPEYEGFVGRKYKIGLRFQAEAVREAISKGWIEHPKATHDHSRLIMHIIDEANRQLGNVYK